MSMHLEPPLSTAKHPAKQPMFWIRIAFSLALLAWLAQKIDWSKVGEGLATAQPGWFVLAALLLMLSSVLAGLRWAWLMKRAGFLGIPMRRWQGLYFASSLINQGLPTVMGGDSFRAWQASRHSQAALTSSPDTPRFRLAVLVVVLDRSLGLMGNLMLGCLGLISLGFGWLSPPSGLALDAQQTTLSTWLFAPTTAQLGGALLALMSLGLAVIALCFHWRKAIQFLTGQLSKLHLKGLLPAAQQAFGFRWLVPQVLLAISIHALGVAALSCCLYGVGVTPPLSALMVTLPAIGILLLLPISISGWGLRESALSAVLALWSVPSGLTVLASIVFGLMTLLATLPGLPALLPSFRQHAADRKPN